MLHLIHPPTVRPSGTLGTRLRRAIGRRARVAAQGLVEYALILVLIAVVAIGALTLVGKTTSDTFDQVNCVLTGGKNHQDQGNGKSNSCKT
jgi:pilus assembly protein Flp/PilA